MLFFNDYNYVLQSLYGLFPFAMNNNCNYLISLSEK